MPSTSVALLLRAGDLANPDLASGASLSGGVRVGVGLGLDLASLIPGGNSLGQRDGHPRPFVDSSWALL